MQYFGNITASNITAKAPRRGFWLGAITLNLLVGMAGCDGQSVTQDSSSSAPVASQAASSSLPNSSSELSSSSSSMAMLNTQITLQEQSKGMCLIEGIVEADHSGFVGAGYANADNEIGAAVVWHVRALTPGQHTFTLRYAYGGAGARDGEISVNGQAMETLSLPSTQAWDNWQEQTINLDLAYGGNTIRYAATGADGLANIDSLTIEGYGIEQGNCASADIIIDGGTAMPQVPATIRAATFDAGASEVSSYDWDFGDGSQGSGESVNHTFNDAGEYIVTLTVTDIHGDQTQVKRPVRVTDSLGPVRIFIAGDSTVSTYNDTSSPNDQAGWGQMLHESYNDQVTVFNHAVGGRTARRFIDEGRLDRIWDEARAGDYLLVQFGTNDGHRSATYQINGQQIPYYLDPATSFKTWLQRYVDGARSRDIKLVFVTPPPRNSAYCTGGNGTGGHAQGMRELAASTGTPLVDLNRKSVDYLMAICPAPTPEDFFLLRGNGTVDGTHFQENGARIMSRMVADGIGEAQLPLDQHRR